jgi:heterotetrameric sarcosine oxidase gamma subunit
MIDAAAVHGAMVETRSGWEVISSFGDPVAEGRACAETVGFADLSHMTKIEAALASPTRSLDRLADRAGGWWVCPVRPDLQLVLGTPDSNESQPQAPLPEDARATDLTAALAAIALAGPAARELFARFCALDLRDGALPVRGFRPGSVARTPGYVLREAPQRFLVLAGAAYGVYLWQLIADAAEHLGGRPVGVDALPAMEPGDA